MKSALEEQGIITTLDELLNFIESQWNTLSPLTGNLGSCPKGNEINYEEYEVSNFQHFVKTLSQIDITILQNKCDILLEDLMKIFILKEDTNWERFIDSNIIRLNNGTMEGLLLMEFVYHCYLYFLSSRRSINEVVSLIINKNALLLRLNLLTETS